MQPWENRIIGHDVRPASDFLANPFNHRIHTSLQQQVVDGLLDDIGWITSVTVNERTGRVVNGHLRITLALRRGDDTPVPCELIDLSEEEEALALATLDASTALALPDAGQVHELISRAQADNAAVLAFLDDMRNDATRMIDIALSPSKPNSRDSLGDRPGKPATVKLVLAIPDVHIVEQAIRATGEANRAQAFLTICTSFLEAHGGNAAG